MYAYSSNEFVEENSNILWSLRIVCLSHVILMQSTFSTKLQHDILLAVCGNISLKECLYFRTTLDRCWKSPASLH